MINRLEPEDDPELAAWDMLAEMTREVEKNLDHSLAPELEGLVIRGMLVDGDPSPGNSADSPGGKGRPYHKAVSCLHTFDQLLQGSVTAKVLHGSECPVLTGARGRIASAAVRDPQRPPDRQ